MLQKMQTVIAAICIAGLLSGCGEPKGSGFIGHWVGGSKDFPASIDIKLDDGIYQIDKKEKYPFVERVIEQKWEATALSNDVLSIGLGALEATLRLENEQVFFENKPYSKVAQ